MRNFYVPHMARWVAVCISIFSGSLIFQGCGGGEPSAQEAAYADLDKAFPNGRPAYADSAARAQDATYIAEIKANAEKNSQLSQILADCEAELAHIKNELAQRTSRRMGETVPEDLFQEVLDKNPLYQQVLAKRNAAAEAVEAQRQATMAAIRNRMTADVKRYDEMLAEADAKAKAAGVPTRAETLAQQAAPKVEQKPIMEAPTVKALSEKTGIPLAPAMDKQ